MAPALSSRALMFFWQFGQVKRMLMADSTLRFRIGAFQLALGFSWGCQPRISLADRAVFGKRQFRPGWCRW